MTLSPHIAQARAACLRAAVETRTGAETPEAIVDRARKFEAYVLADNAAPQAGAGAGEPRPRKAAR